MENVATSERAITSRVLRRRRTRAKIASMDLSTDVAESILVESLDAQMGAWAGGWSISFELG